MIKVYAHENRIMVFNAKNLLEAEGIEAFIKNEFSHCAVGDLAPQDAWPELWLYVDDAYDSAKKIIDAMQQPSDAVDWQCQQCKESNDGSFELCWNCGKASL